METTHALSIDLYTINQILDEILNVKIFHYSFLTTKVYNKIYYRTYFRWHLTCKILYFYRITPDLSFGDYGSYVLFKPFVGMFFDALPSNFEYRLQLNLSCTSSKVLTFTNLQPNKFSLFIVRIYLLARRISICIDNDAYCLNNDYDNYPMMSNFLSLDMCVLSNNNKFNLFNRDGMFDRHSYPNCFIKHHVDMLESEFSDNYKYFVVDPTSNHIICFKLLIKLQFDYLYDAMISSLFRVDDERRFPTLDRAIKKTILMRQHGSFYTLLDMDINHITLAYLLRNKWKLPGDGVTIKKFNLLRKMFKLQTKFDINEPYENNDYVRNFKNGHVTQYVRKSNHSPAKINFNVISSYPVLTWIAKFIYLETVKTEFTSRSYSRISIWLEESLDTLSSNQFNDSIHKTDYKVVTGRGKEIIDSDDEKPPDLIRGDDIILPVARDVAFRLANFLGIDINDINYGDVPDNIDNNLDSDESY